MATYDYNGCTLRGHMPQSFGLVVEMRVVDNGTLCGGGIVIADLNILAYHLTSCSNAFVSRFHEPAGVIETQVRTFVTHVAVEMWPPSNADGRCFTAIPTGKLYSPGVYFTMPMCGEKL